MVIYDAGVSSCNCLLQRQAQHGYAAPILILNVVGVALRLVIPRELDRPRSVNTGNGRPLPSTGWESWRRVIGNGILQSCLSPKKRKWMAAREEGHTD